MDTAATTRDELYGVEVRSLGPSGSPLPTSPCPVCDCVEARPRFRTASLAAPVVVCEHCGLGRFEPMPDALQVASFYPPAYYGGASSKFQPIVEWLVRRVGARHIGFLSSGLAAGDRVLDVGCGRGVILGPLADRGFEVHGVEISQDATQGVDPRAEIRIAPTLADARYPDGFFHQVVIWHVLEHLREPRATLEEIRRILVPGGRLVVAVPNFESLQARWLGAAWFHLDLPRHLYQFPLGALLRLLRDVGFETQSEHHFSLRQNPFGWIQSLLNKVGWLPRNGLYQLLHLRGSGQRSPFGLGTRLTLYGLFALLAPLGVALSLASAALRQGATIHVVARRTD